MSKFKVGERYEINGTTLNDGNIIVITEVNGNRYSYKTIKGVERGGNRGFDENSTMGCGLIPVTNPNIYELHITCNDGKTTNAVYKVNGKIEKRTEAVCCPSDTFNFATGAQTAFDRVFPKATPTQPIAPQEDKPKFKVGQKVKVIGNCCCHGYSRGTILTLVRSVNFLRREPDWYVGEGTDYVSERDIEPYAEPEKEPEPVYYSGKVVCVDRGGSRCFTQYKGYEFKNGIVIDDDGDEYNSPCKTLHDFNNRLLPQFIPYLGE